MIVRIFLCIGIVVLVTMLPLWLSLPCILLYALRYTAYELIPFAFFCDGFYGLHGLLTIPWYTIGAIVGLVIIEWFKPLVSVYNQ